MSLPEKELFTLDEIIERWRFSSCDHATLLDYARRDLLVFSVYLRDLGHHRTTRDVPDGRITTTHSIEFQFRVEGYKAAQVRYLKADDARRILEARQDEQIGVNVLYSSPTRTKECGTGYLQAMYFTAGDMLITLDERRRFESMHKVRVPPGTMRRLWSALGEQSNQRALATLGGWFTALALAAWTVFTWWAQSKGGPK